VPPHLPPRPSPATAQPQRACHVRLQSHSSFVRVSRAQFVSAVTWPSFAARHPSTAITTPVCASQLGWTPQALALSKSQPCRSPSNGSLPQHHCRRIRVCLRCGRQGFLDGLTPLTVSGLVHISRPVCVWPGPDHAEGASWTQASVSFPGGSPALIMSRRSSFLTPQAFCISHHQVSSIDQLVRPHHGVSHTL
jgi:hypothetical protein